MIIAELIFCLLMLVLRLLFIVGPVLFYIGGILMIFGIPYSGALIVIGAFPVLVLILFGMFLSIFVPNRKFSRFLLILIYILSIMGIVALTIFLGNSLILGICYSIIGAIASAISLTFVLTRLKLD